MTGTALADRLPADTGTSTHPLARALAAGRPPVCGILNVTPDSFSDGGRFDDLDRPVAHGCTLAAEGADLINVGGESTRPGSRPPTLAEELARVVPVSRLSCGGPPCRCPWTPRGPRSCGPP